MSKKQLFRSKADRMIAGVCGGIAQYADMDSTAVRAGFVALTVLTAGKGLILYGALCVIMPAEDTIGMPEVVTPA